jgi:leader peptidase (prepilin peptidase) / N-methyltransferase
MPSNYMIMGFALKALWVIFVMAFGGCFGSLINVLAYRLPLGISIVSPPSRCPKCDHKLAWYDNIPVFGWLFLRGKCRYCKTPISAEYPLVEAAVALLFGVVFIAFVVIPPDASWLGVNWGAVRPMWSRLGNPTQLGLGAEYYWGIVAIYLFMLGCLAGMTVVDAKTFQIPLYLPWAATLVAFIGHPLWALWLDSRFDIALKTMYFLPGVRFHPPLDWPWNWAIPSPGSVDHRWTLAVPFGGIAGLVVAMVLLRFGLIRRSFEDYDEWEKEALAKAAAEHKADEKPTAQGDDVRATTETEEHASTDEASNETTDAQEQAGSPAPPSDSPVADTPELWIQYPHARREMVKEFLFLTPCVLGMVIAGMLGQRYLGLRGSMPPLWIQALAGVSMGYLVGGGVVWGVRIFGSLAFGKEAMGLGDVHLMAAVGACIGWIDSTVAFFVAAPVGLVWVLASAIFGGKLSKTMPYGPYLAFATLLVILGKPLVVLGLNALIHPPPGSPIYIP